MKKQQTANIDSAFAHNWESERRAIMTCTVCNGSGRCPVCCGYKIDPNGDPCQACGETGKCAACKGSGKEGVQ